MDEVLITFLIQSYISEHNITLAGFCRRLGYYEKTVNGWLFKRHRPSKRSLQYLLGLFIKDIPEHKQEQYTNDFWAIVKTDQSFYFNQSARWIKS